MQLISVRITVDDIQKMVHFYEQVTETPAVWYTPDFAELRTPTATLAIGSTGTLKFFNGEAFLAAAHNKTVITEFSVADVDALYSRLSETLAPYLIQEPTKMPWGNKSLLFRDPEGNLVNFFTPAS